MNFSTTRRGDYGLTAALYLSTKPSGDLSQIHEIAQHCDLPEPFLAQIMRLLVRGGIVTSKKGVRGGFALAKEPADITFLQVLEALEGPVAVNRCQNTVAGCEHQGHCGMESVWERAQHAVTQVLRDATLAEVRCPGKYPFTPASAHRSPATAAE